MFARASRASVLHTAVLSSIAVIALGMLDASCAQAQSALSPPASARPGYVADTSCSENGEPASSGGWFPGGSPPYPLLGGQLDDCIYVGGSLTLRDEGAKDSTPLTGPAWIYEATGDSVIVGGFVDLTMLSPGGEAFLAIKNGRAEWTRLASCAESCTTVHADTATIPSTEDWILTAEALCTAPVGKTSCTTTGVNAELSISRATMLLRNTATVETGTVTGSLTESPVSGTANVAFKATDSRGPGIYRVAIDVDGKEILSETPEVDEAACVPHGTYDEALNFHAAQPCPQELPVRVEVPTAGVSNGTHLVEVIAEDAAGHRAVAYDKRVDFENGNPSAPTGGSSTSPPTLPAAPPARGPANGTPASDQATLTASWSGPSVHTASAHLATAYGHGQSATGKLTSSAGVPIARAAIEVSETPSSVGATAQTLAVAHTAPDGSFTATLPRTLTSGTVTLAYRSHLGDPSPAATAALTVSIPAPVTFSVAPHVTRVHHTLHFSGTLHGPIPPGGKHIEIEAREHGGSWVEFSDPDTEAGGKFKSSHWLKYAGPALYEFRAVCKHEADFPFAEGKSRIVRVWER